MGDFTNSGMYNLGSSIGFGAGLPGEGPGSGMGSFGSSMSMGLSMGMGVSGAGFGLEPGIAGLNIGGGLPSSTEGPLTTSIEMPLGEGAAGAGEVLKAEVPSGEGGLVGDAGAALVQREELERFVHGLRALRARLDEHLQGVRERGAYDDGDQTRLAEMAKEHQQLLQGVRDLTEKRLFSAGALIDEQRFAVRQNIMYHRLDLETKAVASGEPQLLCLVTHQPFPCILTKGPTHSPQEVPHPVFVRILRSYNCEDWRIAGYDPQTELCDPKSVSIKLEEAEPAEKESHSRKSTKRIAENVFEVQKVRAVDLTKGIYAIILKIANGSRNCAMRLRFDINIVPANGGQSTIRPSTFTDYFVVSTHENQFESANVALFSHHIFKKDIMKSWYSVANGVQEMFLTTTGQMPPKRLKTPIEVAKPPKRRKSKIDLPDNDAALLPTSLENVRGLEYEDYKYLHHAHFRDTEEARKVWLEDCNDWFLRIIRALRNTKHLLTMWQKRLIWGFRTRAEIEESLNGQQPGTYILRFSTHKSAGVMVISLKMSDRVIHYIVPASCTNAQISLADYVVSQRCLMFCLVQPEPSARPSKLISREEIRAYCSQNKRGDQNESVEDSYDPSLPASAQ